MIAKALRNVAKEATDKGETQSILRTENPPDLIEESSNSAREEILITKNYPEQEHDYRKRL
jgi:hypothetical protein